jgi:hypothetical protein
VRFGGDAPNLFNRRWYTACWLMSDIAALRTTLKRGALLCAANWPVVLVQFVAESTFKLLLGVPVVGGAVLVALALGRDLREMLGGDVREIAASVAGALLVHPLAFTGFLLSFLIVLAGGSTGMFLIKGGTVSVLAASEDVAGPLERQVITVSVLARSSQYSIERFIGGCRTLFRRYLRLGAGLFAIYGLSGVVYLALVFGGYVLIGGTAAAVGWTLVAAVASSALVVWITIVNLVYLLLQMIVAVENCSVSRAVRLLWDFLRAQFRDVALMFLVVLGLVVIATGASLVATASLGLISFVPLFGLAVFPLQAAAWLVRGLVFQYLGLTALGAYLALYRGARRRSGSFHGPTLVRTAS